MASSGEKSDVVELVSCDVCPEVFPSVSKAITHKHKVHPDHDSKYFCPWCGKLFTMKHLHNKHVQTSHESQEHTGTKFPCDYCEVDFYLPSAMVYHNKFFHRQDVELAAIGHSKKLKLFNQEPLQIFYCPFCGEEYFNKVNLHKHMGDDHGDENQSPEDVMRCALCDAIFYHLDAYELHLTFHSTEDLYSEENEIAKQITEFSLETTPPIMEKVENESQDEQTTESMGIGELLQQAMDESNDNTNDGVREKKKKHKKHKKSKKAAITLDEFLTMNTDVFGEGLDFHGIEEVPTQVVAKQLKKKPVIQKIKPSQPLPSPQLEKLKMQGIVVKKNPAQVRNQLQGVKVVSRKPNVTSVLQNINKAKPTAQPNSNTAHSNDILTKLLNQSNSQIKITKKPNQSNVPTSGNEPCKAENSPNVEKETKSLDEDNTVTSQVNVENKQTATNEPSETMKAADDNDIDDNTTSLNKTESHESQNNAHSDSEESAQLQSQSIKTNSESNLSVNNKTDEAAVKENILKLKVDETEGNKLNDTQNVLKNISQHLTIKSLKSNNCATPKTSPETLTENENCRNEESDEFDDFTGGDDSEFANPVPTVRSNDNTLSSMNSLKHLSHLTIKPANNSKNESQKENPVSVKTNNCLNTKSESTDLKEMKTKETNKEDLEKNAPTKLDALKNLSKHITVKSLSQTQSNYKNSSDKIQYKDDFDNDDIDSEFQEDQSEDNIAFQNKDILSKDVVKRTTANLKSPQFKNVKPSSSSKILNNQPVNEIEQQRGDKSCENILKKLTNVTAKPLNRSLNQQTTKVQKVEVNALQKSMNEKKNDEIEIFNIDDSDDEDHASHTPSTERQIQSPNIRIKNQISCQNSVNMLHKINKVIKPKTQIKTEKEATLSDFDVTSNDEANLSDFGEDDIETNNEPINHNSSVLHNKLKNLSNITFKSNNSPKISPLLHKEQKISTTLEESSVSSKYPTPGPNISVNQSPHKNQNMQPEDDYDSDEMSPVGVKITELPGDYTSDDDIPLHNIKANDISNKNSSTTNQAYLHEEQNDYYSEKDMHEVNDDFEEQIKSNTLQRPSPKATSSNRPACLSNLKNITIKSTKDNKEDDSDVHKENPEIANQNRDPPIKPCKPKPAIQNDGDRLMNRNASTSSNQMNTINKEVTVQTFRSKTVIQEITTTVTKTIRTVNQSTKEEVHQHTTSHGHMSSIRPQKVIGMRPQQAQNFPRVAVRPAAQPMGTKVRHIRPATSSTIRPSNQLVPFKPRANVARLSTPRMPRLPVNQSNNSQTPVPARALKISPNAIVPSMKRPSPEESNGPFSCFKKPKESLIPETPVFTSKPQAEAVHYASTSQMSKTNTTMKTMKGNSVVTSMQKAEASSSSTQISRLDNLTGLKVVKTSQKQVSKVEENVEMSAPKRSTLEAIEKLQRHGLIVKKPRVEEPESEHSDSENEYYEET